MKKYNVNISQIWSKDICVSAKNKKEAEKKAWAKYKASLQHYDLLVDELT